MTADLSRRQLFGRSIAAAGAAAAGAKTAFGDDERRNDNEHSVREPSRRTPIVKSVDVLVCGGGPAGVAAAISAARAGASVQILEGHGCLGGVWTSGMLSYVIDAGKPGFNAELIELLAANDARFATNEQRDLRWTSYLYDVETMKVVLESLCTDLKIGLQFHTRVVGVETSEGADGPVVSGVFTESKSGREAWRGRVVIDATGDGDVGALAGCAFEIGQAADEKSCPCQPMSLMGVIAARPETLAEFSTAASSKNKDRLFAELAGAGVEPSYAKPTVWHMGGPVAAVMLNHEYGVRPDDADAITAATIRARRELFEIVKALRNVDGWDGVRLVSTAEQIGVRDGRRIRGREMVTVDDVVAGRRRSEAVCTSDFCVDVHAMTKSANRKSAYGTAGVRAKPFDIPFNALIAAGVSNLLLAGRCISGDFFAHASYRVTGNAVAMGEYAGVGAALAAESAMGPHRLDFAAVEAGVRRVRAKRRVGSS